MPEPPSAFGGPDVDEWSSTARVARAHLDLMRGVAALVVLASHFLQLMGRPNVLGHLAVVAFFVLSGFLVATSTCMRPGYRRYAAARASRILTVFWPALAIGGALDAIGMFGLRAPIYFGTHPASWLAHPTLTPAVAVKNAIFLQSIHSRVLGTNAPLWTLAYEVWFYVAFPFVLTWLTPQRMRRRLLAAVALVALALLVGRYVAATFSLWLLGVAVAMARLRAKRAAVICALLVVALPLLTVHDVPFTKLLVRDLVAGTIFAGLVAHASTRRGAGNERYVHIARALADVSYSLYLVHVPSLVLMFALEMRALAVPFAIVITMLVWLVFERRTPAVRRWLAGRAAGISSSPSSDQVT